ncbi:MAG: phosphoribosyl-ATP diphosphatase [Pseudomonadota bacterium]
MAPHPTESHILDRLDGVVDSRKDSQPEYSYVAGLLQGAADVVRAKVDEESSELAAASAAGDQASIVHEAADLIFHWLVLLRWHGIPVSAVWEELETRFGVSGLDEKSLRSTTESG